MFLMDYVYNRFPRVKRKYDNTYRLWQELPTDVQYEKRCVKSEIDKVYGQSNFHHLALFFSLLHVATFFNNGWNELM